MMKKSEDLGRRLLSLKERLEEKKEQRAKLQGELAGIMRRLEQEFEVGSLEEAEARVAEDEQALRKINVEITRQVETLEKLMEKGR